MSNILCYGDSNTYGYDPRDSGRYDSAYRWCDILASKGNIVVNEGLNGREIPTSAAEYGYLDAIINRNPNVDTIILALGINDAYNMRYGTAKKIADRWRGVFENVLSLKKFYEEGKKIILIAPPIGPTNTWGGDFAQEVEETLFELANEYKVLSDELGIDFADANAWGIELAYDGVHFTESGNITFSKGILNIVS